MKGIAAETALNHCNETILGIDTFSLEESLNLAFLGLVYATEALFHAEDLDIEKHRRTRENYSVSVTAVLHSVRLSMESTIAAAQSGDFELLKGWVGGMAAYCMKSQELRDRKLGEKLSEMFLIMPDNGDGWVLPVPAWMDSRFNGE